MEKNGGILPKLPSLNELIKYSIGAYKENWRKFFWLLILPLSLSFIASAGFDLLETFHSALPAAVLWPLGIVLFAAFVYFMILYILAFIAEIRLVGDLSKDVNRGDIWRWYRESRPLFWTTVAVSFVYAVLSVILSIIFVIPGVIFMVSYCFALYSVIYDGVEFEGAFGSSRQLVKNYWWAVFGRVIGGICAVYAVYLLVVIIIYILSGAVTPLIGAGAADEAQKWILNILSSASGLIFGPLMTIYMVKLFRSLKEIKK